MYQLILKNELKLNMSQLPQTNSNTEYQINNGRLERVKLSKQTSNILDFEIHTFS